jgi:hypothetical protein
VKQALAESATSNFWIYLLLTGIAQDYARLSPDFHRPATFSSLKSDTLSLSPQHGTVGEGAATHRKIKSSKGCDK